MLWNIFVAPIRFSKEDMTLLAYAKKSMEYGYGGVAINPKHTKLITTLRTAVEKGEETLDKEVTSHNDSSDAFRTSLLIWLLSWIRSLIIL